MLWIVNVAVKGLQRKKMMGNYFLIENWMIQFSRVLIGLIATCLVSEQRFILFLRDLFPANS